MSKVKRILITEPTEIAEEAVNLLRVNGYDVVTEIGTIDRGDINGLFVRTYTKITAVYLDEFPNLRYILRAGVGLDNIDLAECQKRGIKVYNAPGSNSDAVAEYIVGMAIYALRQFGPQIDRVKHGNWRDLARVGKSMSGKTFGLVGCGNAGRALAKMLRSHGVICIGYDPYVNETSLRMLGIEKHELKEVLEYADVVAIMLPLTAETEGIMNKERFHMMKKGSVLINVSRGEMVDEQALVAALSSGQLSGAVLDVIQGEPIINRTLLGVENLVITPHIAGFTETANVSIATEAVQHFLQKGGTDD